VHGSTGEALQADRGEGLVDPARSDVEDAREIVEVLAHRQVAVDGRRLGDVADLRAQRGRPGGAAEHAHLAARDDLDADDGAHERRLAAA
jgi:hypothetical protein